MQAYWRLLVHRTGSSACFFQLNPPFTRNILNIFSLWFAVQPHYLGITLERGHFKMGFYLLFPPPIVPLLLVTLDFFPPLVASSAVEIWS